MTGRASGPSRRSRSTGPGVAHHPRLEPAVREVVRRRQAQRLLQLSRPPREAGHGDQVAFHWEGEPGDMRAITYGELLDETCRVANALEARRGEGRPVAIYMGMVPETAAAMLACARIGAPHSVVFGGFTADSLQDRINDAEAKVLVTADGAWRRAPRAAEGHCRRGRGRVRRRSSTCSCCGAPRTTSRCTTAATSGGTTGRRPVDRVPVRADGQRRPAVHPLHVGYHRETQGHHAHDRRLSHAGRVHAQVRVRPPSRHRRVLVHRRRRLGHRPLYIVYGPLANRATCVLYEGTPDYPDKDRFWSIVEKYKVTILYTAPTAIRTFMKWGDDSPRARPVVAAADRHRR